MAAAGALGANFLHPDIVPVVTRALACREPRAAYDIGRLNTNLLSSRPLAFDLFGPLSRDLTLAARFVTELLPGTLTELSNVLVKHSPGRGEARFTGDAPLQGRPTNGKPAPERRTPAAA
nr:hypothetical protein [Methylobacterium soli]